MIHVRDMDAARVVRGGVETAVDGARTVGVYAYPGKDDEVCPGFSGGCKGQSWRRLHPEGYMVHTCGRRQRIPGGLRALIRGTLLDLLGINYLPRDATPAAFRNPPGWD